MAMRTMDFGLLWCVNIDSSVIINVLLWLGMLIMHKAINIKAGAMCEIPILSVQFFCDPKTSIKKNWLKKVKVGVYKLLITLICMLLEDTYFPLLWNDYVFCHFPKELTVKCLLMWGSSTCIPDINLLSNFQIEFSIYFQLYKYLI